MQQVERMDEAITFRPINVHYLLDPQIIQHDAGYLQRLGHSRFRAQGQYLTQHHIINEVVPGLKLLKYRTRKRWSGYHKYWFGIKRAGHWRDRPDKYQY